MPAWVKDEGAWKKAKAAAAESKGKSVEDLGEGDWGLVTHIYQQMTKTSTLDTLQEFLQKARKRLSDENPDYSDIDESIPDSDKDYDDESSSDDDEMSGDAADKWLQAHSKREDQPDVDPYAEEDEDEEQPEGEIPLLDQPEPEAEEEKPAPAPVKQYKPAPAAPQEYSEYEPGEDEEAHQAEVAPRQPRRIKMGAAGQEQQEDPLQPSPEELREMRTYTRPWEEYARKRAQLEADPTKNPLSHKEGRLIEAAAMSHADEAKAREALKNSDEYKKATRTGRMRLEQKFNRDWAKNNPDHIERGFNAHEEAHKKGEEARAMFARAKDDKIRHIAGGGVQPGAMSLEEGLQHAGGSREDEDSAPSGIQQDRAASFAAGHPEFLRQYMADYEKRGKKFAPMDTETAPENRPDPASILGDHPAMKMPEKAAKFNKFFNRYYPLIDKVGRNVVKKLGLQDANIDKGLLDYAGMHAIYQAVNDYDHGHAKGAKFTTHLSRKMNDLMHTALSKIDEIPPELRRKAKKFDEGKRNEMAAPVKQTNAQGVTTTINPKPAVPAQPKRTAADIAAEHHPDVADRLKRIAAAKAPLVRKQTGITPPAPVQGKKWNVNYVEPESDDEGAGPSPVKSRDYSAIMPKKYTGMQGTAKEQTANLHNKKGGEE